MLSYTYNLSRTISKREWGLKGRRKCRTGASRIRLYVALLSLRKALPQTLPMKLTGMPPACPASHTRLGHGLSTFFLRLYLYVDSCCWATISVPTQLCQLSEALYWIQHKAVTIILLWKTTQRLWWRPPWRQVWRGEVLTRTQSSFHFRPEATDSDSVSVCLCLYFCMA